MQTANDIWDNSVDKLSLLKTLMRMILEDLENENMEQASFGFEHLKTFLNKVDEQVNQPT